MTQIGRSYQTSADSRRPGPAQPRPDELVGRTSASATGQALVPTAPSPPTDAPLAGARPSGAFLAQLIATSLRLPQTRARRRAEPGDASAAYQAAHAAPAGVGVFLRSLL